MKEFRINFNYFSSLFEIVNLLKKKKSESLNDTRVIGKILQSLDSKFNYIVVTKI